MSEVDEKNETQEYEDRCSNKRDVVAPKDKKGVGDEERHDNQDDPEEDFRTPPTLSYALLTGQMIDGHCSPILNSSTLVSSIFNADERQTEKCV